MFTGIIQGIGKVIDYKKKSYFLNYTIEFPNFLLEKLKIGYSVSNNGCCLTVTFIQNNQVTFDIIKETIKMTNLANLKIGDLVNLERSIKYGDEIGGHLISGHIITTGKISKIFKRKKNLTMLIVIKNKFLIKYIFYKGFIAIDGISLTVGEVLDNGFFVHLIPETLRSTTMFQKNVGDIVNIEIDNNTKSIVETTEKIVSNFLKTIDKKYKFLLEK
ncbi:MAG: riboflavin synthase subunit alpha [Arsenophonus sp.]|nr:MAG: riboflavin synthase subunit alpha [Arsenophonus sp.]